MSGPCPVGKLPDCPPVRGLSGTPVRFFCHLHAPLLSSSPFSNCITPPSAQANVDVWPDLTYRAEAPVDAACPGAAKFKTTVSTVLDGEVGCEARHVWESAWLAGQRERVAVTGQHTCIYRVVEVEGVGQAGTGPPTIVKLPIRATLKAGGEEVV